MKFPHFLNMFLPHKTSAKLLNRKQNHMDKIVYIIRLPTM
jgi:hypothetical protein